jgi:hypothetical protein
MSFDPMSPLPPMTTIFMISPQIQYFDLESDLAFKTCLYDLPVVLAKTEVTVVCDSTSHPR